MAVSQLHVRRASLCASLLAALALHGDAPKTEVRPARVAMADGVKLATDVYLPTAGKPPYPTILLRTPYNKVSGKAIANGFCARGYAVVVQDMRGRFASEGKAAIIFGNDGLGGKHKDGHDTLRWIAKQDWSDGKVVTVGGSALGIVQNMAAPGAPEALRGQVVSVAFSDYYHQAAYQGGVWRKELLEGWLKSQKLEDVNLPTFLKHTTYDDFWKGLSAESHADRVNAPGLFVGGWYDIFLQGTINSFTTIQERGGPNARGRCFLVIAPTAHGPFTQKVEYPNAARAPLNYAAPRNLLEHWLKGERKGVEKLRPVHYYVMGDTDDKKAPGNVWRSADSWPPLAAATPCYLRADRTLGKSKPDGGGQLTYKYDPEDPVPTVGGQNLLTSKGPMDQRKVESRADVLVFTTEALAEPVEVTGRVRAKLFVSSDCPDTDFAVKLCDVYPDGRSMLVTDGIRRASLRSGFEKRELLEKGRVYELEVDLWSTSLVFNKGHRIRVAVSSSNAPRFEPNANTGEAHPSQRQDPGRDQHRASVRQVPLPRPPAGLRRPGRRRGKGRGEVQVGLPAGSTNRALPPLTLRPRRADISFTVFYLNPRATDDVLAMVREQMPAGWRLLTPSHPTEFTRELGECDFLVVADHQVTAEYLALAPKLRMIQHQGVGYERIDLAACRARGIPLGLTPQGTSVGVAEHTLLLILASCKRLVKAATGASSGRWMQWELRQGSFELAGAERPLLSLRQRQQRQRHHVGHRYKKAKS
jgi:predicted acyl esterase